MPSVKPAVNAGIIAPEPELVPLARPANAPPVQLNTVLALLGVDAKGVALTGLPGQIGPWFAIALTVVPIPVTMETEVVPVQLALSVTVTTYVPVARLVAVVVVWFPAEAGH